MNPKHRYPLAASQEEIQHTNEFGANADGAGAEISTDTKTLDNTAAILQALSLSEFEQTGTLALAEQRESKSAFRSNTGSR